MDRKIVWTNEPCACCGRASYVRRDGREYLYKYRPDGAAVCTPRCDKKLMDAAYEAALEANLPDDVWKANVRFSSPND